VPETISKSNFINCFYTTKTWPLKHYWTLQNYADIIMLLIRPKREQYGWKERRGW
jgi:hypothetical protein